MQPDYLVLGLGISGLATAKFLASQNIAFNLADTRSNPPNLAEVKTAFPQAKISLGELTSATTLGYKYLLVSPGLNLNQPAIQAALAAGAKVFGDIEVFCQELQKLEEQPAVLAITGSNAKSTITTLVGQMLKAAGLNTALGGNLGIPVLSYLTQDCQGLQPCSDENLPEVFALELSSFQLETTFSLAPQAAIFLNFSPDHLDRHASLEDYRQAKLKIFNQAEVAIYNRADLATQPASFSTADAKNSNPKKTISFGLDAPPTSQDVGLVELTTANNQPETWLVQGEQPLMPAHEIQLEGNQGLENVLAAFALCLSLKPHNNTPEFINKLRQAAASFTGLPHRCEFVAEINGIKFYNDSKATNLGAMLAAVTSLSSTANDKHQGKLWLILGGDAKGQDFSRLNQLLKNQVAGVALIGSSVSYLAQQLTGIHHQQTANLETAVQWLAEQAQAKDTILLSPACASWDEFKNFEHRGEVFRQCVLQLT